MVAHRPRDLRVEDASMFPFMLDAVIRKRSMPSQSEY